MLSFLKSVCERLESQGLDYMVSGSMALNAYTVPRMTRDIDLVIALAPDQLDIFVVLFSPEKTYFSKPAIEQALDTHGMFNVIDFETGYKLDFIVLKPEPFRQAEFSRRIRSQAFGFPIWLVQVEDLVLSKLIWIQDLQSDRQTEDLKHLLSLETIDRAYLNQWVNDLNLDTFGLLPDA